MSVRGVAQRAAVRSMVLVLVAVTSTSAPGFADEGPLRIAMSGAFQPFSTTDDAGALVGLDADIAREVARRVGREPALVQTDWAGIQAALHGGKVDLICGSMAITPERQTSMLFSLPYYVSGAQVFAAAGVTDVRGRRVGVTEDSTYATFIAAHSEQFPDVVVVRFGSEAEIVAAMNADKVDAFVSDRIVGGFYAQRGGALGVRPLGPLLYREACGISARLDDVALVRDVNVALLSMIQDGTYARIYERWVGAPPDLEVLLSSWGAFADHLPASSSSARPAERPAFADRLSRMIPLLVDGAALTLLLSLLTALLALVTGTLVGVLSVARASTVRRVATSLVWLVRGTPLLVQLFIAYFAIATWVNRAAGTELVGAFGAALLALVINTTAYNAETVRGGILAVPDGQWQAARALGMSRALTLRRIILPQALRSALPSLGNNLVVLIKDTSLVGAITLVELTYAARNVVFQTGQPLLPFAVAGAFYLVMISLLSFALDRWARLVDHTRGRSA